MRMQRLFRPALALSVLAVTLFAGTVLAQPGHGRHGFGRGHGPEKMFENLDLTDAQKEQIHDLFSAQRDEGKAAHEALRTARTALHEAIHGESLDEGAIRSASAQVASLEADQAVARAELFQAIRQVLTPEQLAQLDTMKAERQERRGEHREHREHRRGHRGERGEGSSES